MAYIENGVIAVEGQVFSSQIPEARISLEGAVNSAKRFIPGAILATAGLVLINSRVDGATLYPSSRTGISGVVGPFPEELLWYGAIAGASGAVDTAVAASKGLRGPGPIFGRFVGSFVNEVGQMLTPYVALLAMSNNAFGSRPESLGGRVLLDTISVISWMKFVVAAIPDALTNVKTKSAKKIGTGTTKTLGFLSGILGETIATIINRG